MSETNRKKKTGLELLNSGGAAGKFVKYIPISHGELAKFAVPVKLENKDERNSGTK